MQSSNSSPELENKNQLTAGSLYTTHLQIVLGFIVFIVFVCFVASPSQHLWSLRDGQFI